MSILDQLAAPTGSRTSSTYGAPVQHSSELERIKALPRRPYPTPAELEALVEHYTKLLSRPNPRCYCRARFGRPCALRLRPAQALVLHEMVTTDLRAGKPHGLLASVPVGGGKSLVDLLGALVVPGCKTAVLFIPPNLKAQMVEVDLPYYGQHWQLPNIAGGGVFQPGRPILHIVSYSLLSSAKSSNLLEQIRPDLVVGDEIHNLRAKTAARTKRFVRYFAAHPETRLACWSGTVLSRSIVDFAHLSELALGEGSPVPREFNTLDQWAKVIDPSPIPMNPGALEELCQGAESVREAFARRLQDTRGMLMLTTPSECNATLIVAKRDPPPIPKAVKEAMREVDASWTRPDGEEMVDALTKANCLRQLSCGFYYRWRFPNGEPADLIDAWFRARQEWHRELRTKLKFARPFLDSPLLCTKAAIRFTQGKTNTPEQPVWNSLMWEAWRDIRGLVKPVSETVWIDTWLAEDAVAWAAEGAGIVWTDYSALGHKIRDLGKLPYFGGGPEASRDILLEKGTRPIVASIAAHGTGKNLQCFSRALLANVPSSATSLEQTIGRMFRPGQEADEVLIDVYQHTPAVRDAFDMARDLSVFVEGTSRAPMAINRATMLGFRPAAK